MPNDEIACERVLLVGSSGGHLAQLLALRPWWQGRDRSWVSFPTPDVISQLEGETVDFVRHPTTRNLPNLFRNFLIAWRVLRTRKPDLIVSTGAAAAVPFFVWARLLGINTVYIEVYDRIGLRTLTGRICKPLATVFCVQWPQQQQLYPGSQVIGRLM